jgi:hypothetical protein
MDHAPLQTASEVIDACGGPKAVATLTNSSIQAVCNWRGTGRLAPRTFLVLSAELERRGVSANPSLWGMQQPETAA